jgi:AraC-like DNA-binding protein
MKIEGLHEKGIFEEKSPFRLLVNREVNFNYPAHWHNAIELVYVLENEFAVTVNSKKYEMREKDILFIPSGAIHEFHCTAPSGKRIFVNFELTGIDSYWKMDWIENRIHDVRLIAPENGILYDLIKDQLVNMLHEFDSEGPTSHLYYTARIIDLIVILYKSTPPQINIENTQNSKKKIAGLEKINKSFEYIEKNYSEDIHLKDIAGAAGFSEYYFSRLFKEITEKSFHQYLNEVRIKKAEALLSNSNYTVSEAAYASGFSSIATFDRLFREIKGCTPQEFRKLRVGN